MSTGPIDWYGLRSGRVAEIGSEDAVQVALRRMLREINQEDQPDADQLVENESCYWIKTSTEQLYLCRRVGVGVKKIELT